jgi:hypothetical protein
MKKLLLLIIMTFSIASYANPSDMFTYSSLVQKKKKKSGIDKSRILIGPGLGFGAAYRTFSINISPSVAYCLTNNFHVGSSLGFSYFQAAEDYTNFVTLQPEVFKHKFPAYSFSVFARYLLANFLILNFEPEINNTKFVNEHTINWATGKLIESSQRKFIASVLVGLGYAQRMGEYSYTYFTVNYDIVQNPNTRYYQTLDYRAGIMINLWR